jgi:hypothetical protein
MLLLTFRFRILSFPRSFLVATVLDNDRADAALELGQSLLEKAEKLEGADKATLLGDVYRCE